MLQNLYERITNYLFAIEITNQAYSFMISNVLYTFSKLRLKPFQTH